MSDVRAEFVADPFGILVDGTWRLFFEVMDLDRSRGVIGLASSTDGFSWSYERTVLVEPFHLSYPFVFRHEGDVWMIPETLECSSVRLYRASSFPFEWRLEKVLFEAPAVDATPFEFEGAWYLFSSPGHFREATLNLHVAPSLFGPWRAHPASPIRTVPQKTVRPAGRILGVSPHPILFTQDGRRRYGHRVWAHKLLELTPDRYREQRVGWRPVVRASGRGWNAHGMHHVDAHLLSEGTWLALVDGFRRVMRKPGPLMLFDSAISL